MEITTSKKYNIASDECLFYKRKEVLKFMKNKHLSFDDRLEIEKGLKEGLSFKQIGKNIKICSVEWTNWLT